MSSIPKRIRFSFTKHSLEKENKSATLSACTEERYIWKEITEKCPHLYHIPTNLYKSHVCKVVGELKSHDFVVFVSQKHLVLQMFSLCLKESIIKMMYLFKAKRVGCVT